MEKSPTLLFDNAGFDRERANVSAVFSELSFVVGWFLVDGETELGGFCFHFSFNGVEPSSLATHLASSRTASTMVAISRLPYCRTAQISRCNGALLATSLDTV